MILKDNGFLEIIKICQKGAVNYPGSTETIEIITYLAQYKDFKSGKEISLRQYFQKELQMDQRAHQWLMVLKPVSLCHRLTLHV